MIISIDFDNTWTRDPRLFRETVGLFRSHGHTVIVVTGRSDIGRFGSEVRKELSGLDLTVIFAGEQWKRDAARAAGYNVAIWIDDMPEYIGPQVPIFAGEKS